MLEKEKGGVSGREGEIEVGSWMKKERKKEKEKEKKGRG